MISGGLFTQMCEKLLTLPVLRTLKEDLVWPYDWDNPFDFEVALNKWIESYNTDYPHQSLGNLTPKQYHETYVEKELCSNLKTA